MPYVCRVGSIAPPRCSAKPPLTRGLRERNVYAEYVHSMKLLSVGHKLRVASEGFPERAESLGTLSLPRVEAPHVVK